MILLLIPLLMLASFDASAAVRRLSTDCSVPAQAPSEAQPFDLDSCTIQGGDDITLLLTDIQAKWPSGFFVRAPSRSLNVVSNSIQWPTSTKIYVFLEDEDPNNKLLVQHAANPTDFYRLWAFSNFDTVKIGGPNLSVTLRGNHPGLANCNQHPNYASDPLCDWAANAGLLEFRMSDGTVARLVDVRANIKFSQQYSIYTMGSTAPAEDTGNVIDRLNVAGLHYATSGVFFHYGVRHAWADPDRTVFSDPYVRVYGWTGVVPGQKQGGLPMGCNDKARDQLRIASFNGYGFASLTGGFTLQYGGGVFIPRNPGRIGSALDPFVIKVQDWGVTGPGTGYPAGVRVKKTGEGIFFKGDPAGPVSGTHPSRFIRLVKLPDNYGSGPSADPLLGCSPSNDWGDGPGAWFRFENNVGSSTEGYDIEWVGDWRTPQQGGTFLRGELAFFGDGADTKPNWKNTFRVATGTTFPDMLALHDESTVTGPGTYTSLSVTDASAVVQGRNSRVTNTHVSGTVTVSPNTENTIIQNVWFTGASRTIISVGSGATVAVSRLCAPSGSTITGTGSVTYDGVLVPLPFTISNANSCSVDTDAVPNPPENVLVS